LSERRKDYTHSKSRVQQRDDGNIRMRCRECGKKLKAPTEHAGQVFTCRHCKTSNVLPFLDADGLVVDEVPADQQADGDAPAPSERESGGIWTPEVKMKATRIQQIDELKNSLFQAYSDIVERSQSMLLDENLSEEQQKAAMEAIRRDLDVEIRRIVIRTRDAMKGDVARLRNHPMSKSAQIREQLEEALRHYSAFLVFAQSLFG